MNLFLHQQALGDFVVALPVLGSLAAAGPSAVIAPYSHALLAAKLIEGDIDPVGIEAFEFTRLYAVGGPTSLSPRIAELFATTRRIVSFVSYGNMIWAENVYRLMPEVTLHTVIPRPPEDWQGHVSGWHRSQLEQAGFEWAEPRPMVSQGRRQDGPILMHPGSGGLAKCWTMERWIELILRLQRRGLATEVIYGAAEQERFSGPAWDHLKAQADVSTLCTSLEALFEIFGHASAYVGNDAGPTHLAAAAGLPTVAMFGPSNPVHWRPLGQHVLVLCPTEASAMDWLAVDRVERAVTDLCSAL
jgi:hypothetical protein